MKDLEVTYTKPLQQSIYWKNFQEKMGKSVIYSEKENYTYLGILNNTLLGKYLFLPYGPYIKSDNGLEVYDELIKLAKKEKCIFVRIEPQNDLSSSFVSTCKRVKDINPSDTLIIDISKSFEDIIANFSASTRRHYRSIKKLI